VSQSDDDNEINNNISITTSVAQFNRKGTIARSPKIGHTKFMVIMVILLCSVQDIC